jgi:spore maturation protein CgeB
MIFRHEETKAQGITRDLYLNDQSKEKHYKPEWFYQVNIYYYFHVMSFRLFNISSMYKGYLESFYKKYPGLGKESYASHYSLLLDDTTEFTGSYTKTFNALGIEALCIIVNDKYLQNKWRQENRIKSKRSREIIFQQINRFKPDILWIENLSFIDKEWLSHVRAENKCIRLIIAYHCAPIDSNTLKKLEAFDFVITCTPGLKQEMEKMGLRAYLIYHGFDENFLNRIDDGFEDPINNFVFCGSLFPEKGHHTDRIKLIETILDQDLDIALYANLEKNNKIKAIQSIHLLNMLLGKLRLNNLKKAFPFLEHGESTVKNYSGSLLKSIRPPVFGIEMFKLLKSSKIVLNIHGDVARNNLPEICDYSKPQV